MVLLLLSSQHRPLGLSYCRRFAAFQHLLDNHIATFVTNTLQGIVNHSDANLVFSC